MYIVLSSSLYVCLFFNFIRYHTLFGIFLYFIFIVIIYFVFFCFYVNFMIIILSHDIHCGGIKRTRDNSYHPLCTPAVSLSTCRYINHRGRMWSLKRKLNKTMALYSQRVRLAVRRSVHVKKKKKRLSRCPSNNCRQ